MKDFPPFRLDTVNECLWRRNHGGEEQIRLTPKAFAVLRYLVGHAGRLVTQDELLNAVWPGSYVQPEVLKSQILDIRRCLGDNPKEPRFIETLPRRGYQFIASLQEAPAGSKRDRDPLRRPLVGRNAALTQLSEGLQRALGNEPRIVFVTGDAGIGKTALVDEFECRISAHVRVARAQCMNGYAGMEAYYPMLEAVGQLCLGPEGNSVLSVLARQAPTWLVQFPAFMGQEQRALLEREIRGTTRERMLREICDALMTIASDTPLLLVFEDLHRADHSTVDLISALARRRCSAKLMVIGTYLPADLALSDHPLNALTRDLLIHQLCDEIALAPLNQREVAEYMAGGAAGAAGAAIPEGLAGLIHRYTEGNPLFMVTVLEHLTERNVISRDSGRLILAVPLEAVELRAPESLRQMIEVQIGGLSEEERRVLEVGSIAGDLFSTVVGATAANLELEKFESVCEGLSRRHRMVRAADILEFPNGIVSERYEFVHPMFREVLYRRQSAGRRAKLHRLIREQLETLYTPNIDEAASELAHHCEQGRDWLRAINYLQLAADTAARRFGPVQAARILAHALELVGKLPDADRAPHEFSILEKSAAICSASLDSRAAETRQFANRPVSAAPAAAGIRH
jgi:predicted ATPase